MTVAWSHVVFPALHIRARAASAACARLARPDAGVRVSLVPACITCVSKHAFFLPPFDSFPSMQAWPGSGRPLSFLQTRLQKAARNRRMSFYMKKGNSVHAGEHFTGSNTAVLRH